MGLTGGSEGIESACKAGDLGSISQLGRYPGGGHGNPGQYYCLENPHGQRRLAGYSPWCLKELDITERPSMYIYILYVCVCVCVCVCVYTHTISSLPIYLLMDN